MAFKFNGPTAYPQEIADTSTTQMLPLGTQAEAYDLTLGYGEFIYLKGVASTAVGDVVTFNQTTYATTRSVAGARGSVAIAMSANVANQYGWYMIYGVASVKSGTVVSGALVYVTATAGQIDDAVVAGDKIDGMILRSANSGGFATVGMQYPFLNGNG